MTTDLDDVLRDLLREKCLDESQVADVVRWAGAPKAVRRRRVARDWRPMSRGGD